MKEKEITLVEGKDYYLNSEGFVVLTKHYLQKRGYCCKSGCENCPYGFTQDFDPDIPVELQLNKDS